MRLAAAAAALRQYHESATKQGLVKILDNEMDKEAGKLDAAVQASITDKTSEVVRTLALALQKL